MSSLIQHCTNASRYDGPFGGNVGWPAAGMGYVFTTEQKHLIVIDGGHSEDAEDLITLLTEQAGNKTATVDLWILTHPHLDHYGALREIAARDDLRAQVQVKKMAYYFPVEFRDRNGKAPCVKANDHMTAVCEALKAETHVPASGKRIIVDSLILDFLFVPYDCSALNNPNSLSLIFAVQGGHKRVMMTGDACPVTMQYCVEHYGENLKCDILQLPHHGLCDTGNADFYRLVGAEILLVPISAAGDRAMKSGVYGDAPLINRVAEDMAKVIYHAFEGTVTICI